MKIKYITSHYAVSEQIAASDFTAILDAGFKAVICNRPDNENPPHLHFREMEKAAESAGISLFELPLTHQTMTPENIAKQFDIVNSAEGPVLAYCASGTRCSVIWALSQVGQQSAESILEQTANAGYDLSGLRGALR